MTVPLRALAISGALTLVCALSPANAQGDSTSQSTDSGVSEKDIKTVLIELRAAWRDYAPCEPHSVCDAYFESYGVALTFNDGSIVPFAHEQRHKVSAHDCIVNARAALERGDRGLAVQWVMASYLRNDPFRSWIGDHPDTVIAALQRCCDKPQ
jgi:hypothetical protein